MGRNHRKKNKWKRDDAGEAAQLGQRRLRRGTGSGSGSGVPADGGDNDPESYTNPTSRNRGRKGSGKLQGGSQDGSISGVTTWESVKAPVNGGHIPVTLAKESGDDLNSRTVKHRANAEAFAEPPTEANPDSKSLSASTLHAESGLPGVPPEEKADSPVCALNPVDQVQEQKQGQKPDVQAAQGRNTEQDEKQVEVNEQEKVLAMSPELLVTETNALKEGNVSGDGGVDNDNSGLPATSNCRGMVVPALPFGSTHINGDGEQAVVVATDRPFSMAWAGGRKGRPLMKSVENLLSEWFCAQEAKVGAHYTL